MHDDVRHDPASELLRLIDGFKIARAIHAAAVLGVADHIANGLTESDAIADAAGADRSSVYRLLRALAAHGVLREGGERRFTLTAVGEHLRSDAEPSLHAQSVLLAQPYSWQAWSELPNGVRTGGNPFRMVHGIGNWDYRERHPEQNAIFNAAMTANAARFDRAIADAFDWTAAGTIADIGGSHGSLLATILRTFPGTRGLLFDRPHVVAGAGATLAEVADRCEIVPGDFFEAVPSGCGAYVLKFILHDWDDDDARRILATCHRAMPAGARLVLIERLIGPDRQGQIAALSDLNMLVGPGGRERSLIEYRHLLRAAGFQFDVVAPAGADLSLLVGTLA